MKTFSLSRAIFLVPALAGLLALAGCNWPNIGEDDPPSDFGQKAMAKHMQNGQMNDYQYQKGVGVFTAPGQPANPATPPSESTPP